MGYQCLTPLSTIFKTGENQSVASHRQNLSFSVDRSWFI